VCLVTERTQLNNVSVLCMIVGTHVCRGSGSSVGIATDYGLDGPGIEFRFERLRWSRGLHASLWYPRSRDRSRPKPSDFSCWKNPQHAVRYDTNDN
jgi:hypothetical protein